MPQPKLSTPGLLASHLPLPPCRWLALLAACWAAAPASAQTPSLVEFLVGGKIQRGLRLVDLRTEAVIMGRDGWLHSIESADAANVRPVVGEYRPISVPELRNELRAEFGRDFEVVATNHFLVVQPRGRGRRWPELFEHSHRAFITYMQKRGVPVRQGRFPMVAVVFPDSASMYAEFRRLDIDVSRVAGLYSNSSNRVMTHDGGHQEFIAATVRHEAAHQSAFNTGVHSRVNDTPQWITEGIGQLFEPAAMANPLGGDRLIERANHDSLRVLRKRYGTRGGEGLARDVARLVRGDEMFGDPAEIDAAYAVSWAMMFYLAERDPEAFARLLHFTATRPPFQSYSAGQRALDFERIVGQSPVEFSRHVDWFVEPLH